MAAAVANAAAPLQSSRHLFARGAVDALVGDLLLPLLQEEVLLCQRTEPVALERVVADVGHASFDLPLVLRGGGTARRDMDAVVTAEVGQLRVDLRIKPVRLKHRRFQVVDVQ